MDCQEFDKNIKSFVVGELDYRQLDDFIDHYNSCEECHEELEINYLLSYMLEEEEQTTFNLRSELDKLIENEFLKKKNLHKKIVMKVMFFSLTEIITIIYATYFVLSNF